MKKTKIICTIGPASSSKEMLKKMIKAGMNCARFNFSHGTHESQKVMMDTFKEAREELHSYVPILLDTKGPEIRVKNFKDGSIVLKDGDNFTLDTLEEVDGDNSRVAISYHDLYKSLKVNDLIMIDDGKIQLKLVKIDGDKLLTTVLHGGKVSNHKSINVPNVAIPMPFLSEVDKSDILFGLSQGIDFVAASFTRSKQDVLDLRNFLDENGGQKVEIICKIENHEGIKNFDEILEIANGIMVARGDLGVEIPFSEIPTYQKMMIDKCRACGKIVVVATQMLESMTSNPRPTRAEVSDVANAIFDGTTCIMLSGESANGSFPLEAVQTMDEISLTIEKSIKKDKDLCREHINYHLPIDITQTVCKAAYEAAEYIKARAIIVLSTSGHTAKAISAYRPDVPVIGVCATPIGCRQLSLYYNVVPILTEKDKDISILIKEAISTILDNKLAKQGDTVVVVSGTSFSYGHTDSIQIYEL